MSFGCGLPEKIANIKEELFKSSCKNLGLKDIFRKHFAKNIQLAEVDELTPGKVYVFK